MLETVSIHNLEVVCLIGIWEWEKGVPQKLQLDLELGFDFSKVIGSRRLEDTIDYCDLARRVEGLLQGKNFGYLEVLVETVTDLVFETYPALSFEISVRKFVRDIPAAAWVGVMRKIGRHEWTQRKQRKVIGRVEAPLSSQTGEGDLAGKTALVTGSARRLGRALAEHLGARGANVAIHYRGSEKEANEVVDGLRARHPQQRFAAFKADLRARDEIVELAASVARELAPIDVLVNNVGHYAPRSLLELTAEDWETTMRVNLDAIFHLSRAVVDALIARNAGWGRIVNIGQAGSTAVLAHTVNSAYHVSKTGMAVLTRTLAEVCGPHGITVNLLSPGVLDISVDFPLDVNTAIPLRRLGTVDDVVGGLAYLTSKEAEYVTGASLDVSGGYGFAGAP